MGWLGWAGPIKAHTKISSAFDGPNQIKGIHFSSDRRNRRPTIAIGTVGFWCGTSQATDRNEFELNGRTAETRRKVRLTGAHDQLEPHSI